MLQGGYKVLDIRSEWDRARSCIPSSLHVPFTKVGWFILHCRSLYPPCPYISYVSPTPFPSKPSASSVHSVPGGMH